MQTSQIYIASAGSGKTFTLVKEYLKILFRQAQNGNFHVYRNILAITFTNKATHEMKERIINELTAIATGQPSDQLDILKSELVEVKQFKSLADKILIKLLHDFSSFNVLTIDSFFQNIIRSFAKELNLPLNFEIILDKSDALEYAVDELIDQIGKDKEISNWLRAFAFSKIDDDKSWNFRNNILKLSNEIFNSSINLGVDTFEITELKSVKKKLDNELSTFEKTVNGFAQKALAELDKIDYPIKGFIRNYLPKWLNKIVGKFDVKALTPNASLAAMMNGEKPYYSKAFEKSNAADIQTLQASSFYQIIDDLYHYISDNSQRYVGNSEIYKNIYALGVIHTINKFIKAYRTKNNALFLSDTTELINQFITLDITPFLFEKLANKIQYVFIDEFQDTSNTQWNNFLPIIQNILSATERDLHVLMVGDAKQSIYRWRDGDFELLTHKAKLSLEPFEVGESELQTNFRSLPTVVNFNNNFFNSLPSIASLSDNELLKQDVHLVYKSLIQRHYKKSPDGKASVFVIQKDEEKSWKTAAIEKLFEDINQLKEIGYSLSDIAILVRKKKHGVEISRHLQNIGIEILSEETLLLQHNDAIKLLVAGLQYLNNKDIPLNYVNFTYQVSKHQNSNQFTKNEIFTDHINRKILTAFLPDFNAATTRKVQVYDAVELLIQQLNINCTDNLFVNHFRQLIFDHLKNESGNIGDFLEWWELQKEKQSVRLKNGSNKINVLTIHKSKGLEFPVVLVPYCDWDFYERKHENFLWVNDKHLHEKMTFPIRIIKSIVESDFSEVYLREMKLSWIDNINLLYVAFTRAKEVIHISTPFTKPGADPLPNTAAKFIIAALQNQDIEVNEIDDTLYEIGSYKDLPSKKEVEVTPSQSKRIDVSNTQAIEVNLKKNFESEEIRIGNLVHLALYYLATNKSDIAFDKASNDSSYSDEEIKIAQEHFHKNIVANSLFTKWLKEANQSWDEQPIYFEGNVYRPDKIFLLKDKYIIVDYKTGAEQSKYQDKLKLYIKALQSLDIKEAVEGYILYTESGLLKEVS